MIVERGGGGKTPATGLRGFARGPRGSPEAPRCVQNEVGEFIVVRAGREGRGVRGGSSAFSACSGRLPKITRPQSARPGKSRKGKRGRRRNLRQTRAVAEKMRAGVFVVPRAEEGASLHRAAESCLLPLTVYSSLTSSLPPPLCGSYSTLNRFFGGIGI